MNQGRSIPSSTNASKWRSLVFQPRDTRGHHHRVRAGLIEPHGWLTLRGFHWLTTEPASLPGLPGRWWADASQAEAHVEASSSERLTRHGAPIDGTNTFTAPEYGRLR